MRINAASREYVYIPVESRASVTGLAVKVAMVTDGTSPQDSDFQTAAWDATSVATSLDNLGRTIYTTDAYIIVGPAQAIALTAGSAYKPYVRITSTPEVPTLPAIGLVYAD
jgi:hypothetical protein